jgi:hypothetical protein
MGHGLLREFLNRFQGSFKFVLGRSGCCLTDMPTFWKRPGCPGLSLRNGVSTSTRSGLRPQIRCILLSLSPPPYLHIADPGEARRKPSPPQSCTSALGGFRRPEFFCSDGAPSNATRAGHQHASARTLCDRISAKKIGKRARWKHQGCD